MAGEIFISYRRLDERWARLLRTELESRGVAAWYDADIGVGEDWRAATSKALEASRIFVLLYSEAAAASEEIAKELAVATMQKKLIVPVRLEDYPATGPFLYELASRNWIDVFEDREARLAALADSLAAKVEEADYAKALPFERPVGKEPGVRAALGRAPRWAIWAAGGLVALLAVVFGGLALRGVVTPRYVSERIAFFGVDSPPGDTAARAVAQAATSAIADTFTAQQKDIASSADTSEVPIDQRTERAQSLGATYAISGSVRRDGNNGSVALQIEEAPSHTLLWSDVVTGPVKDSDRLSTHAAALLTDTLSCVIAMRQGLRSNDTTTVSKLPSLCRDMRSSEHDQARWEEISQLVPNSAFVQAATAVTLGMQVHSAPPSSVEAMRAEAEALTTRALALDPNQPDAQLARVLNATNDGIRSVPLEAIYLDGTLRAPRGASIATYYGGWLCSMGRFADALPYLRAGVQYDPLSGSKPPLLASDEAVLGQTTEAETVFAQVHARSPSGYEWPMHLIAALFRAVGNADAIIADSPEGLPSRSLVCWKVIARAARSNDPATRRRGGGSAAGCAADGSIDPEPAIFVAAMLGDLDSAFGLANKLPAIDGDDQAGWALFDPRLTALHADPRFLPLTQRLGLFGYWKSSGRHPDFCGNEKSAVCTALGPPAAAAG